MQVDVEIPASQFFLKLFRLFYEEVERKNLDPEFAQTMSEIKTHSPKFPLLPLQKIGNWERAGVYRYCLFCSNCRLK